MGKHTYTLEEFRQMEFHRRNADAPDKDAISNVYQAFLWERSPQGLEYWIKVIQDEDRSAAALQDMLSQYDSLKSSDRGTAQ